MITSEIQLYQHFIWRDPKPSTFPWCIIQRNILLKLHRQKSLPRKRNKPKSNDDRPQNDAKFIFTNEAEGLSKYSLDFQWWKTGCRILTVDFTHIQSHNSFRTAAPEIQNYIHRFDIYSIKIHKLSSPVCGGVSCHALLCCIDKSESVSIQTCPRLIRLA